MWGTGAVTLMLVMLAIGEIQGQPNCGPGAVNFYQYCIATIPSGQQRVCSDVFQNGAHPVVMQYPAFLDFLENNWADLAIPGISRYRIGLKVSSDVNDSVVWWDNTVPRFNNFLESDFPVTTNQSCFAISTDDDMKWISYDCADIGLATLCQYDCQTCRKSCGPTSVFTAPNGTIQTVGFPSIGLPFDSLCHWRIRLPPGEFIQLIFTDFNVPGDSRLCLGGRVAVIPGEAPDWFNPQFEPVEPSFVYCGTEPPGMTVTDVSSLSIVLATGSEIPSFGFRAEYSTTDIPGCSVGAVPYSDNTVQCDGSKHPRAVFATRRFPDTVPSGRHFWSIRSAQFTFIKIKFLEFDIPGIDGSCSQQFLYDDLTEKRYCNEAPPPSKLFSSLNEFSIEVSIKSALGFLAEYQIARYAPSSNFTPESVQSMDDGWYLYKGFMYRFGSETQPLTWFQAEGLCIGLGGHLVSILNHEEAEFLQHMQQDVWQASDHTYIGLTDKNINGIFRWSDGSPTVYTDWIMASEEVTRRPQGGVVNSCTIIYMNDFKTTALWLDLPCALVEADLMQYICKKPYPGAAPPEPIVQMTSSDANFACPDDFNLIQCGNRECTQKLFGCTEGGNGVDSAPRTLQQITAQVLAQNDYGHKDACAGLFFQCANHDCIPFSFACDFVPHCADGSDEENCDYRNCSGSEFQCENGECVEACRRCDLVVDCADGSDEAKCVESRNGFRCFDGTFVPLSVACDRTRDCDGGLNEDELEGCNLVLDRDILELWEAEDDEEDASAHEAPEETCEPGEIQCKNGFCVSEDYRCIYDIDRHGYITGCRDVTHLDGCGSFECPELYYHCPAAHCIPPRFRCDGKNDCPYGEDEIGCDDYTCPGLYRCHGATYCLQPAKVCDSVRDCPDGDDEFFCGLLCPEGCDCIGLEYFCEAEEFLSSSSVDIPSVARSIRIQGLIATDDPDIRRRKRETIKARLNAEMEDWFPVNASRYHLLMKLEIVLVGIEHLSPGMFGNNPNLAHLDLSYNNIAALHEGTFRGLFNLEHLILSGNPLTVIQDGAFIQLSNLQILQIKEIRPRAFSMEIFVDLSALRTLQADEYLFCCIAVESLERCEAPQDQFSSCADLMRNGALRAFIWILGVSAFLGNFLVILFRSFALYKGRDGSPIQTFFIANLAVSDFLMGAYMIIIGSADLYYKDVYALHEEAWKQSLVCKFGGFLSVLSSEASVFMVTLLSLDRCAHIVFPFKRGLHLRRRSSRVAVGVLWVAALLIAALPILITPYFHHNFYGRSSVCLALPLTEERQPGWEYMFLILCINFFSFLVILFAYLAIFVTVKRSAASTKGAKNAASISAEVKLAGKMALIIGTDFACWMPIIILAVLATSGVAVIPPEVYAWTAVFILPLNSSINPYLYTISTYTSRKRNKERSNELVRATPNTNSSTDGETGMADTSNRRDHSVITVPALLISHNNGLSSSEQNHAACRENTAAAPTAVPVGCLADASYCVDLSRLLKGHDVRLSEEDVGVIRKDITTALAWLHSQNIAGVNVREELIIFEKKTDGGKKAYLIVPEDLVDKAPTGPNGLRPSATDEGKRADQVRLEQLLRRLTSKTS